MTFEELDNSLPNGFHDAQLETLEIDYIHKCIEMRIKFWVGDLNSSDTKVREAWRLGSIEIEGFDFCTIDAPDTDSYFAKKKALDIDAGSGQPEGNAIQLPTSSGAFQFWIFVTNWNSYIRISAKEMTHSWL